MLRPFRRPLVFASVLGAAAMLFWLLQTREERHAKPSAKVDPSVKAPAPISPAALPRQPRTDLYGRLHETKGGEGSLQVAPTESLDPGVRRQIFVRIDRPLSEIAPPDEDGGVLIGFTLPVFDDKDLEVEILRHESHGPASGAFVGRIAGRPDSFVFLGYDGPAEAGTVQIPAEGYLLSISYAGDGLLRISELDPQSLPGCAPPLRPPVGG